MGTNALSSRQLLAHDPQRPQFHFLPPANWMNDPNGLIQWQGQYHLFYQYNPVGPFHNRIHWGHAVSDDLVHWQDWPVALTPTPDNSDQDGCWSGCAVNNNGVPTLLYSGVHPQVVCLATSDDGLMTWQKRVEPVISTIPDGLDAGSPWDFRDPFVWREGEMWYMVMGSRRVNGGGLVLLYRSNDLLTWEYLHPLLDGDLRQHEPFWTGTVWECPNFFRLGDKYVLIVSFQEGERGNLLYTGYYVGDYVDHRFYPTAQGILEYGGTMYAPQVMLDEAGRRLLWGWLWEGRSREAQIASGWAGVMTLPRVLSLRGDGTLTVEPPLELQRLRGREHTFHNLIITPDEPNSLGGLQGNCLEILVTFEPGTASEFGLKVCCSSGGEEQTRIIYSRTEQTVTIDRQQSSLDEAVIRDLLVWHQVAAQAPSAPGADGTITWHIFLDRSVLDVFVRGRVPLSSRIYPTRPDSLGMELFSGDSDVVVKSVCIWSLNSIWNR